MGYFENLSDKQKMFVLEYPIDFNATQAAIRAGYAKRSAGQIGFALLKKHEIQCALQEKLEDRKQRLKLDADYVLGGLMENKERAMQNLRPKMAFDPIERRLVRVEDEAGQPIFEYDGMVANNALIWLGKHLELFTDKKKIEVNELPIIIDDIPESNDED